MITKILSTIIVTFIYFSFSYINAQSKPENTMAKYQAFYEPEEETIYTQLNKDAYFEGEKLWFKTYIYGNKTQQPFLATANVKAIIYNSKGIPLKHKIYYANQASTSGSFSIDSTLTPGTYFLKTTTTYMQNFENDRSAINCFHIEGSSKKDITLKPKELIVITPEGGNLIANTTNTIGVKCQDTEGFGTKAKSILVTDESGQQVASFTNNQFGIGKFNFTPKANTTYTIKAELNNSSILTKELPKATPNGIALAITTNYKDLFYVSLHTNAATLPSLLKKSYTILIHKEGNLKKVAIQFEKKTLDYNIPLQKETLYPGINIITLLNAEGIPVAERLVYNDTKTHVKQLEVSTISQQHDSIKVLLKRTMPDSVYVNLNASVLPQYTAAHYQKNNVLEKLVLAPYVSTPVEHPEYYFKDKARKTIYDLDLLLISEGKSSYNWQAIMTDTQEKAHPFEVGFTIKGEIELKKFDKDNQLFLISKKNSLFQEIPLQKDHTFELKKVFISDSSDINFTLINKRGNNKKPKVNYTITPSEETPPRIDPAYLAQFYTPEKNKTVVDNNTVFIVPEAIALSSVEVVGKKKEAGVTHHPLVPRTAKKVTLPENSTGMRVLDLIRANGFQVRTSITDGTTTITVPVPNSINASQSPLILVNDMPVQDITPYNYLRVSDLDALYISKFNSLYGMRGSNGTIHIYTKTGIDSALNKGREIIASDITPVGFSEQEAYYEPQYNKSDVKQFQNFGVLNWLPYVPINKNGDFFITYPNYQYPVTIYLEGIDGEGNIYAEIINIDPKKDL